MRQHIDETAITVRLIGRENARADRFEHLGKFDRPFDRSPPVDPLLPAHLHFLRRQSENKGVFRADALTAACYTERGQAIGNASLLS